MAANLDEVISSLKELQSDYRSQLSRVEKMLAAAETSFAKKGSVSIKDLADNKPVECEICHQTFATTNSLGSHKKGKHGIEGQSRRAIQQRKEKERREAREDREKRPLYEPIKMARGREQEGGSNEAVRQSVAVGGHRDSPRESTKVERQDGERDER